MRHLAKERVRLVAARTAAAAALAASACATASTPPADSHTARVFINGEEMPTTYSVECRQLDWFWTIDTLPKEPGFTAIVQTGATVTPKVMRIRELAGFTGSSGEGAPDTEARVEGTTFRVSGTAHGSFADRPTKPAEVEYRMEARC
ncbi:lipoprotein LpqH [Mycobacterium sp. DSM 3803]|nr:lipoprotein LpqH [Mycobacterium sp. DSM 3803]